MAPRTTTARAGRDDREGLSPSPQRRGLTNVWEEDDDDDDDDEKNDGIDYKPAPEQSEDMDQDDTDGEDVSDYTDGQDNLSGVEIEFSIAGVAEDGEAEEDGNETETETTTRTRAGTTRTVATLTIDQVNAVLRTHGPLRRLLLSRYQRNRGWRASDDDDDDDNEYDSGYGGFTARRRRPKVTGDKFPKIPSAEGQALMHSGLYGCNEHFVDRRRKRKSNISERLLWRKLGLDARSSSRRANRYIAQDLVPSTTPADKVIHYDSRAYSGQFSNDGNFFFSCTQNFKVRMYDTSNPHEWKYYKTVDYPFGQWTITDATLSPDNRYLAYSSIRHVVCLAPTDPSDHSEYTLLDLTNFAPGSGASRTGFGYMGRSGFGIWSLRFSGDGREIVAGTSDHSVVVYDLERKESVLKLLNHKDDVNAVCFGDTSSPHILYSGSDDQTLRVWDRRSMSDGREVGVFVGHTEGLTYVDSKGDGRYVLSNGKDQMMKLWDLRKMVSPHTFDKMDLGPYTTNFDYRSTPYREEDYIPNPNDCSVATFRGHSVLNTLIRCHFSPPGSSNSRYVYSGSEDGQVWIWNMDGTVHSKIDVGEATRGSRPRQAGAIMHGYELHSRHGNDWKTCVRDASWSPSASVIAATSWNGWGMATGTVSRHSWNDGNDDDEAEPPMGTNYNCRLEVFDDYNQTRRLGLRGGLRSNPVRPQRLDQDGTNGHGGGGW